MKKHYATYELSKLAKDAGFDEECNMFYKYNSSKIYKINYKYRNTELTTDGFGTSVICPELTHLQQWVYEKLNVWIGVNQNENLNWIKEKQYHCSFICGIFDCPYKALECGLLEFLKTKQ